MGREGLISPYNIQQAIQGSQVRNSKQIPGSMLLTGLPSLLSYSPHDHLLRDEHTGMGLLTSIINRYPRDLPMGQYAESIYTVKIPSSRATVMAERLIALAALPEVLSSIRSNHMVFSDNP